MFRRDRNFALMLVLSLVSLFIGADGGHFLLIHGATHGAWCWYKVATLLKSAGHNVTALDMAASGINPKQVQEIRSFSEYNKPLITFMASLPPKEKVILVAHSFAGIPISVAMERFPDKISVAVSVTASLLSENVTYSDATEQFWRGIQDSLMDTQYFFFDGPNKPATAMLFGPKFMASMMYQLSPQEDLTLALSLVRRQPLFNDKKLLLKETRVTKDRYGRVPKVYIICKRDKLRSKSSLAWVIERTGPYAEVKVIEDADHMVMFSSPRKLSSYLLELAHKY